MGNLRCAAHTIFQHFLGLPAARACERVPQVECSLCILPRLESLKHAGHMVKRVSNSTSASSSTTAACYPDVRSYLDGIGNAEPKFAAVIYNTRPRGTFDCSCGGLTNQSTLSLVFLLRNEELYPWPVPRKKVSVARYRKKSW